MALIICPDCGKSISDKASACIFCGCPIVPIKKTYDVILDHINSYGNKQKYKTRFVVMMHQIAKEEIRFYDETMYEPGRVLIEGISQKNAEGLKTAMEEIGYIVSLRETDTVNTENNERVASTLPLYIGPVCCPHCRSTSVTTGPRGYSLLTGFIGSSKTVNMCAKCGYKWEP